MDYKRLVWEHYHYRFGLAGEGQADIIARYLDDRRGCVLNVGCGPWPEKISNLSRHCEQLLAMDKSPECLRKICSDRLPRNVVVLAGDAHQLPVANESLDHVLALGLFAYIADTVGVLTEFGRVCRPGGFIMITNSTSRDPQGFRNAASGAGLRLIEDREGYCPSASGEVERRQLVVYEKGDIRASNPPLQRIS